MYLFDSHNPSKVAQGAVLGLVLLASGAAAQSPGPSAAPGSSPDVTGLWIDHTGQGAVEITPCGDRICGRVAWLKNPAHKSRSGKLICGAQVLGDLRREAANAWEAGWIYNPEDEERFSAALKLASANTLLVTGYLGIKLLGETFTWKRATTNLTRCAPANGAT
jgi:uncharacterized protein (DUF2147 family)